MPPDPENTPETMTAGKFSHELDVLESNIGWQSKDSYLYRDTLTVGLWRTIIATCRRSLSPPLPPGDEPMEQLNPLADRALLLAQRDAAEAENAKLRAAVAKHHAQKADDRCVFDDDELYAAFGLPPVDRRVGDKAAMLENCKRFIDRRCESGGWPSYTELTADRDRLSAERDAARAEVDRKHQALAAVRYFLDTLDDESWPPVLQKVVDAACSPLPALAVGGEGKTP